MAGIGIVIPALTSDDKTPGRYGETKYGQGEKSIGARPVKCLITGNALTAGASMTGDSDIERIYDVDDADTKLGAGSEAALQAYAALKVAGVELWAAPVLEAAAGPVAATLTITIGGAWTGTGQITYYIGDKAFVAAVADGGGGTPTNDTADNIDTVVSADSRLFCSCAVAGAVATLTVRSKGVRGNDYYVKQDLSEAPTGMTSTIAGGAAVGVLTPFGAVAGAGQDSSSPVIVLLKTVQYDRIAVAQNIAVELAKWQTHVDSEAGPLLAHLEHIVCGSNGTEAGALALSRTELNAERAQCLWSQYDRMAPAAWVAEMAAHRCTIEGQTPNYNYDGMVLESCAGQEPVDVPLHSEQKSALNEGLTPLKTVAGETQIVRAITTKCGTVADPDYRTLDVGEAIVPDRVRADLIVKGDAYTVENPYAGDDPADDEERAPAGVATPSDWNSVVEAYLYDRQDDLWVQDVADNLPESEWNSTSERIMTAVPCVVRTLNHQMGISVRQQAA